MGTSIYPSMVIGIPVSRSGFVFYTETKGELVCSSCGKKYKPEDGAAFCSKCGKPVRAKKVRKYNPTWLELFVGKGGDVDACWDSFCEEWLHPHTNAYSSEDDDGSVVFGIKIATNSDAFYTESDSIEELTEKDFLANIDRVKGLAKKLGIKGGIVVFPSVWVSC